jgi:hypothetical protein
LKDGTNYNKRAREERKKDRQLSRTLRRWVLRTNDVLKRSPSCRKPLR